ncbi:MAG: hypothetical protein KZQ86_06200 [Candidatus Thiodiazotropha sp. (ex Lucinoma kastoroae)]|nr:hypothetical protein [Candidatus Thiodiazotropha sp. (ex Lucinoma kastoroae)]
MKKDSKKGELKVLGIDLAKQSFQLHGVDKNMVEHGQPLFWENSTVFLKLLAA